MLISALLVLSSPCVRLFLFRLRCRLGFVRNFRLHRLVLGFLAGRVGIGGHGRSFGIPPKLWYDGKLMRRRGKQTRTDQARRW